MISLARVYLLAKARTLEFLRDRRSLGWSLAFPLLVMLGFGLAFSRNDQRPLLRIGLFDSRPNGVAEPFIKNPPPGVVFGVESDRDKALESLRRHQRDLLIDLNEKSYWVNPESNASRLAERLLLSGALTDVSSDVWALRSAPGRPIRYIDWLLPGLVAMNLMFSSLFGVGYVIVRYRKNGVLKRLQVTPTHPIEFLTSQIASRVFVILASALVILYGGAFLTGAGNKGTFVEMAVVIVSGALAMISIGVLMSSRTGSEELASGLVQVVSWPMMLFSGIWFSIDDLDPWFRRLADLFPLTHLLRAMRAIWLDGASLLTFDGIVFRSVVILWIFAGVLLVAGAALFRWNDDA